MTERSSNVRSVSGESGREVQQQANSRSSNARPVHERAVDQRNTSDRSSNAHRRSDALAQLVKLKLSDGPASKQIRGVNAYTSGDTVALACDADNAKTVTCMVLLPGDTTVKPEVTAQAGTFTAHVTTSTPGDYWYAFSATSSSGEISVAEQYFIVERNRVPR